MRYLIAITLIVASVFIWARASEADPPTAHAHGRVTPLMRMKLEKSKAILEGLALEDYDALARNAQSLRLLSLEAGWNIFQTKEYISQSSDFRRATDLIVDAANEKDIHRAALGYVSLTVRCVECHSYMRKHKVQLMNIDTQ